MSPLSRRVATLAAALLPAAAGAAALTLDQALALAVQRSEAAHAARAETTSAREAARAAGQLPDPTLGVGIDNVPVAGAGRFSTAGDSMTMRRIGLTQEWVARDKREARRAAADAVVDQQSTMARAAVAEVRLQAALAYVDAYYAGEARRLAALDEHHAHEEFEAAKARVASATGSAQELLGASGARGLAEDDAAAAAQAEAAAAVALQRWCGVPADELAAPALPAPPAESAYVDASAAVRSARDDIALARREAAVAAAERRPDWSWQLSYGQRAGYADMVSVGVSIPLPVSPAERQDRTTAARVALVEKAQARLEEAMRSASAEYRALASDVARLTLRIDRFQEAVVLPAQQRTEAALAGYRSNQAGLAGLFDARHMQVEARRRLLGLQRELARAQAQLAYRPLSEGEAP